jgi:hypothetical protein
VADAGKAGIGGGGNFAVHWSKNSRNRGTERGRRFLDMRFDVANDPSYEGGRGRALAPMA